MLKRVNICRALCFLLLLSGTTLFCSGKSKPISVRVDSFAVISPAVIKTFSERGRKGLYAQQLSAVLSAAQADLDATPHPIVRVHTAGSLPTDPWFKESVEARRDWTKMLDMGLAYRITGDKRYIEAESRFMNAWLDVYKISLQPIDESPFEQVILAYDLVRSDLSPETMQRMDVFLRSMATGYIDYIKAEKKEDIFNFQSHRLKLALLSSYSVGDPDLIATGLALYRHHLEGNLLAGNVVGDFPKRDALHYAVYDLEPLLTVALAAKMHGVDVFNSRNHVGSSLKGAMDWLAPYTRGEQTHEEFVHSDTEFDRTRAKAGMAEYSGTWQPRYSMHLYAIASNLSDDYLPFYKMLEVKYGHHGDEWLIALKDAGL